MTRSHTAAAQATDAGVDFPLRVAAIDVGSNAIRYVAAEFASPGDFVAIDAVRVPVRLGHSVFLSGHLAESAMDEALAAFRGFRERMERDEVGQVRAVATSAVRESRNGDAFIERVRRETEIPLVAITGNEEARLVWTAVRSRLDLGRTKWMLVDVGGGSVEVSLVDDAGLLWFESHRMGTVRLLEELAEHPESPARFRELLAEYASTLRIPAAARHWNPAGLIATGGNIEELAELAGARPDERGVSRLPVSDMRRVMDQLARMSYAERIEELGLREDRADVILPAAVVYERLATLAGAREMVVPNLGVKEGALLDLVDELTTGVAHQDRRERLVRSGALSLGRRYLFDEEHGRHVARLALALFDRLAEVHELGPDDRRLLLASALLHDVGQYVSYRKHHKHSAYLIVHSELPGIAPRELPLVALVARYHRRAGPKDAHYLFGDLDDSEKDRVIRLAALLRVADALDREHLQRVGDMQPRVMDGRLELRPEGEGDFLLEKWALEKKGRMFADVFGLEPVLLAPDRPVRRGPRLRR